MILSIDTGINNFGLVVFDDDEDIHFATVVQSKKSKDKKMRVSTDYAIGIGHILNQIKKVISTYAITKITCEMPSFGAQSSNAAISLSVGATIVISTSVLFDMPVVYASPREIKETFTGNPNASKKEIMKKCCEMYGWDITHKIVRLKDKPERHDPIYHVMGEKLSGGYFEHIADAIAAYHTCKHLKEFNYEFKDNK